MRRFEFIEGTSAKFWQVEVSGVELRVGWGRIGTAGQGQVKPFATPQDAEAEQEKLVAKKLREGYKETSGSGAGEAPTPAADEASVFPGSVLRAFAPRLASPDPSVREKALEDALSLDAQRLDLVSAIEKQIADWRMFRRPDGWALTLDGFPSPLASDLIGEVRPVDLRCRWSGEPRLKEVPERWLHGDLVGLDLAEMGVTRIPSAFARLKKLRRLRLSFNDLSKLSDDLGELEELEELDLESNRLTELPAAIGRLRRLRVLKLSGNRLKALPACVGDLAALEELDVSSNALGTLPEAIGQLQHLRALDASFNQLTELPPSLVSCRSLTTLDLTSNRIASLPADLGQLQALKELRLANNRLTELPPDIGRLAHLTRLVLHRNRLTEIPGEMAALPLRAILLAKNPMKTLPKSVATMPQLSTIIVKRSGLDRATCDWLGDLSIEVDDEDPEDE